MLIVLAVHCYSNSVTVVSESGWECKSGRRRRTRQVQLRAHSYRPTHLLHHCTAGTNCTAAEKWK